MNDRKYSAEKFQIQQIAKTHLQRLSPMVTANIKSIDTCLELLQAIVNKTV